MTRADGGTLIIGAGLAGLALGCELARGGERVTVLDKGRGVSGRSSTRRLDPSGPAGREARLDHGARFFTARQERTLAWVSAGLEAGWLAEWTRSIPQWRAGTVIQEGDGHPRYVPPAGMNTLGRVLAAELEELGGEVRTAVRVTGLRREEGWLALAEDGPGAGDPTEGGTEVRASRLVLNLPAPQALPLLSGTDIDPAPLAAVEFDPCWAVGALLDHDLSGAQGTAQGAKQWPALRLDGHPSLDWICREHTKRGPGHPPALMLHARADWSRAHLSDPPESVQEALLEDARGVVGNFAARQPFALRWLYATPTVRFPESCGWLPEAGLGWCGDWCTPDPHGPRVEAALLSGWELAGRMGGSGE